MRKLLPAFLFFTAFVSVSQTANYATHRGVDIAGNVVAINSKSYHFETTDLACCNRKLYLTALNSSGNVIFEQSIPLTALWVYGMKMITTYDKKLVIMGKGLYRGPGSNQSCDVGSMVNFFVKLDTLGNKQFETFAQTGDFTDVAQHADSSYYFISYSKLYHYSKTGQFIADVSTGLTRANSLAMLANGNLLINGEQNNLARSMETTTAAISVQQGNPGPPVLKYIVTPTSDIFALAEGRMQRYTSNFALLNNAPVVADSITDFTWRNDSIFVTGLNKLTQTPFYAIFDQNLAALSLSQCTYTNVVPKGIALSGKNVMINTQGTSMAYHSSSFKGFYQFPITGSFISKHNIGVTSFALNSYTNLVVPTMTSATSPAYNVVHPTYNLNVTVKNYGTDTVHSFYLNSYFDLYYECKKGFQRRYDVIIPPQGSVVVNTGNYDGEWFFPPANVQPLTTQNINFCFYTTVPDAANDIDISNDEHCDSLLLTNFTVTGIKENAGIEANVALFPNPFSSVLYIQSDVAVKKAEVYTIMGALQDSYNVSNNTITLDANLQPGVYFIRLETEKGTLVKKVIKE